VRDFRRRYSFDHYMLFALDSEEKRKEPQAFAPQSNPNPLPN
jgi:hypothetical protein